MEKQTAEKTEEAKYDEKQVKKIVLIPYKIIFPTNPALCPVGWEREEATGLLEQTGRKESEEVEKRDEKRAKRKREREKKVKE